MGPDTGTATNSAGQAERPGYRRIRIEPENPEPISKPRPPKSVEYGRTGPFTVFNIADRDGTILFKSETATSLWEAVQEAVEGKVDLRGADLRGHSLIIINGTRHPIIALGEDVKIGCQVKKLSAWLGSYEKVGQSQDYTVDQIAEYGAHLRHLDSLLQQSKVKTAAAAQGPLNPDMAPKQYAGYEEPPETGCDCPDCLRTRREAEKERADIAAMAARHLNERAARMERIGADQLFANHFRDAFRIRF